VVIGSPSASDLRQYFDAHRAEYDRPETFDFEQFQVGDKAQGGSLAAQLEGELGTEPAPAEYAQAVRRYAARPQANLVDLFGQDDTRKLLERPDGTWAAITTGSASHLARITQRHPPQPASFEQVKNQVARAWKEAARKASLAESLKAIVEHYDIRVTPGTEPSVAELSASPSRAEAPRDLRP